MGKYSEDDFNLEEVDDEIAALLNIDDMSEEELAAAIIASYIPGVDECFVNKVGCVPVEDQAVTIPELLRKGGGMCSAASPLFQAQEEHRHHQPPSTTIATGEQDWSSPGL